MAKFSRETLFPLRMSWKVKLAGFLT